MKTLRFGNECFEYQIFYSKIILIIIKSISYIILCSTISTSNNFTIKILILVRVNRIRNYINVRRNRREKYRGGKKWTRSRIDAFQRGSSGRVITRWISAHRIFSASNIKKINRIDVRTHTYYLNKTDARSGCNYSG